MIRFAHLRRSLAFTLAAVTLAACGRDAAAPAITGVTGIAAPTSSSASSRDRELLRPWQREAGGMTAGNWQQVFKASTCAPHGASQASGRFGPGGGTLLFGNSRLIIPGGALRDTVTISAVIPEGTSTNVEFAPHGLQFAKPAGLILSTESCEISNPLAPSVVYLSPDGDVLEYIQAVFDPHWKTIAAPIDHFSGYAIAF